MNQSKNFENRFFYGMLVISLAFHVVVAGYLSLKKMEAQKRRREAVEVVYEKIKVEEPKPEVQQHIEVVKEIPADKQIELLSKKDQSLPNFFEMNEDLRKMSNPLKIGKKENTIFKTDDLDRKITVPFLNSEKISNPRYLSYNQGIRGKILQMANSFRDDPNLISGEVYLTFVLTADGVLKDLRIIEERTRANDYLRKIARESIERSQPFMAFPKDLNYPELTFNIVISFEVNK